MKRRINVRGIIYNNGRLFAVRHRRPKGEADFWCTPGGGLEDGESLTDGIRREIIEETGVTPVVGRILAIQQFTKDPAVVYDYDEFLEFFFHIENADDFEHIDLAATSHGEVEIKDAAFIDPQTADLHPVFLQTMDLASAIAQQSTRYINAMNR